MREPRRRLSLLTRTATFLALLSTLTLYDEVTPRAFNYVIDINGTYWGIQDDDSPRVDTGSIRATQIAPRVRTPRSARRSTALAASGCECRARRRHISTAS